MFIHISILPYLLRTVTLCGVALTIDAPEIRLSDAGVLSGFANLESISLVHVKQCDLSFITKIAGVKQVELLSCEVTDLSPVIGMKQLSKLAISYGKEAGESKGLASFTGMTENISLKKLKRKDSDIVAGYERVRDGKDAYEIFETYDRQYSEEDYQIPQFGITVFKESGKPNSEPVKLLFDVIDNEEYGQDYPRFPKIFYLNDVNFDSNQDILLLEGYFGNQAGAKYSCWLWNPKTKSYVKNSSFSDIMNVSVDRKNHKILGCWRDGGASHIYAMYEYRNGKFIMTNELTEEAVDEDTLPEDKIKWQYTEEKLVNGKMHTVDQSSVVLPSDNDENNVKYFVKGSYWDLCGDKWTQLDYNGKLVDCSIYGR